MSRPFNFAPKVKMQIERHIKVLAINADAIIKILTSRHWSRCADAWPKNIKVVGTQCDISANEYLIAVEHESFPAVKLGERAPRELLRFDTVPEGTFTK